MADELEKQVNQNTLEIGILKKTSDDTLTGVNKLCDQMDKDREQQAKSFDNIDKLLRGKDTENPGLIMKVDRLENWSKRIKGILASLGIAIVGMAGTILSWALGLFGKGS